MKRDLELLIKFLDGNCTDDELWVVYLLLNGQDGSKMLDRLIEEREHSSTPTAYQPDDATREMIAIRKAELMRRISEHENRKRMFLPGRLLMRWVAVFAGVAVLGSVMLWSFGKFSPESEMTGQPQYAILKNPAGIPSRHSLPDGTQVWIAAGSELKCHAEFGKGSRQVELSGEAFFDVAEDARRPFIIRSGDIETRVLGTSFKVQTFSREEQEVMVATGRVGVSWLEGGSKISAVLHSGRKISYNSETGESRETDMDPDYFEKWKSGVLLFRNVGMGLVAMQLENRYGVTVEFSDPEIATLRVSGTFPPEESLNNVLSMLGFVNSFKYTTADGKRYILSHNLK